MRPTPIYVPATSKFLEDGSSRPIVVFHADRLGLSLEQVFEAGAFDAKQVFFAEGDWLRVNATDGRTWATVVGVTDNGRAILEPDTAVVRPSAPARATTRRAA